MSLCRIGIHRKREIGRFAEFKVCTRCLKAWEDPEARGMAYASAYFRGKTLGQTYSDEERALLRSVADRLEAA